MVDLTRTRARRKRARKRALWSMGTAAAWWGLTVLLVNVVFPAPDPVVAQQPVTNADQVLAQGAAVVQPLVKAGSALCYFVRLPDARSLSPELACAAGSWPIWTLPIRLRPASGRAVALVSGKARRSDLPKGTQLRRPDLNDKTVATNEAGALYLSTSFNWGVAGWEQVMVQVVMPALGLALVAIAVLFLLIWVWAVLTKVPAPPSYGPQLPDLWPINAQLAFAPAVQPPTPVHVPPAARPGIAEARPIPLVPAAPGGSPSAENPEEVEEVSEVSAAPVPQGQSAPALDVLGPVAHSGWLNTPARRVVVEMAAYLATHAERPVPAERLRIALWPYEPGQADVALARVHEQASRLRRCLGAERFPEASGGYQLAPSLRCDWVQFQALVEAARAVPEVAALEYLARALALVRGQPFADVPAKSYAWAWEELLVAHMEATIARVAHDAATRFLALGRSAGSSSAARQGLLAVPKDEVLLSDLLLAAAAEGPAALERAWRAVEGALGPEAHTSDVLSTYQRLRADLRA